MPVYVLLVLCVHCTVYLVFELDNLTYACARLLLYLQFILYSLLYFYYCVYHVRCTMY